MSKVMLPGPVKVMVMQSIIVWVALANVENVTGPPPKGVGPSRLKPSKAPTLGIVPKMVPFSKIVSLIDDPAVASPVPPIAVVTDVKFVKSFDRHRVTDPGPVAVIAPPFRSKNGETLPFKKTLKAPDTVLSANIPVPLGVTEIGVPPLMLKVAIATAFAFSVTKPKPIRLATPAAKMVFDNFIIFPCSFVMLTRWKLASDVPTFRCLP